MVTGTAKPKRGRRLLVVLLVLAGVGLVAMRQRSAASPGPTGASLSSDRWDPVPNAPAA